MALKWLVDDLMLSSCLQLFMFLVLLLQMYWLIGLDWSTMLHHFLLMCFILTKSTLLCHNLLLAYFNWGQNFVFLLRMCSYVTRKTSFNWRSWKNYVRRKRESLQCRLKRFCRALLMTASLIRTKSEHQSISGHFPAKPVRMWVMLKTFKIKY